MAWVGSLHCVDSTPQPASPELTVESVDYCHMRHVACLVRASWYPQSSFPVGLKSNLKVAPPGPPPLLPLAPVCPPPPSLPMHCRRRHPSICCPRGPGDTGSTVPGPDSQTRRLAAANQLKPSFFFAPSPTPFDAVISIKPVPPRKIVTGNHLTHTTKQTFSDLVRW